MFIEEKPLRIDYVIKKHEMLVFAELYEFFQMNRANLF